MNVIRQCFLLAVGVCALTACSGDSPDRPVTEKTIVASGSSTVYPITREAARRFERTRGDAHVHVRFTGSTAGFREFCNGELDIANASRAINPSERAECERQGVEYLRMPLAMDAITVVVNPENHWANDISVEELQRLWSPEAEGNIKLWRDIRPEWPDEPIVLFGRGQDSGTYDYFTTVIVGTTRSSRGDYNASEDEEWLAAGIAGEHNALGFFGIGAYHRHWEDLKLLPVDAGNGPIYPSLTTVADGSYAPLSRPLYLYVNKASLESKADLQPFLEHYFSGLRNWLHFTGFMPADSDGYARVLESAHADD